MIKKIYYSFLDMKPLFLFPEFCGMNQQIIEKNLREYTDKITFSAERNNFRLLIKNHGLTALSKPDNGGQILPFPMIGIVHGEYCMCDSDVLIIGNYFSSITRKIKEGKIRMGKEEIELNEGLIKCFDEDIFCAGKDMNLIIEFGKESKYRKIVENLTSSKIEVLIFPP